MISKDNKIRISEIFCSVQGEGAFTGVVSIFIRTQGCTSNCIFCDTSFSWDNDFGPLMTVQEILDVVAQYRDVHKTSHVVVTGGEPTEQLNFKYLIQSLYQEGYTITVETNGTTNPFREKDFVPEWIKFWSISPKLASAKANRKYDIEGIKSILDNAFYYSQLKFVVSDEEDIKEMLTLLKEQLGNDLIKDTYIIVQPNGQTLGKTCSSEEYSERANWLVDMFLNKYKDYNNGWIRIMLQQHKVIWGDRRSV